MCRFGQNRNQAAKVYSSLITSRSPNYYIVFVTLREQIIRTLNNVLKNENEKKVK